MLYAMNDDRHKVPAMIEFRTMTDAEIRALRPGQRPYVLLNSGRVGTAKVNGAVRTWKRDPERIEVPLKWGLYEYATFGTTEARSRLLVRVTPE